MMHVDPSPGARRDSLADSKLYREGPKTVTAIWSGHRDFHGPGTEAVGTPEIGQHEMNIVLQATINQHAC